MLDTLSLTDTLAKLFLPTEALTLLLFLPAPVETLASLFLLTEPLPEVIVLLILPDAILYLY